jgi:transcriptional regulator with XRE-family HTH domain
MNDDLSETETDAPSSESPSETATGLPSLEDALAERAEKLGEFIRDQRRIARLSLRKLSDMAQISNPYLSQIERGLRKPSAEILQQLAKALRISAETLYVQAGILEERTLTEAQKRALVQVLRSFQAENRVGGFGEQSS